MLKVHVKHRTSSYKRRVFVQTTEVFADPFLRANHVASSGQHRASRISKYFADVRVRKSLSFNKLCSHILYFNSRSMILIATFPFKFEYKKIASS